MAPEERPEERPEAHLPLSEPVFQILLSVADRKLHGYAIIQDVETRTDGRVRLTASTLYDAAKRLLRSGWIEEVPGDPGEDARRRHYRITTFGRRVARAEALRLRRAAAMAHEKNLLPDPGIS